MRWVIITVLSGIGEEINTEVVILFGWYGSNLCRPPRKTGNLSPHNLIKVVVQLLEL
jgi:hypothetical protein